MKKIDHLISQYFSKQTFPQKRADALLRSYPMSVQPERKLLKFPTLFRVLAAACVLGIIYVSQFQIQAYQFKQSVLTLLDAPREAIIAEPTYANIVDQLPKATFLPNQLPEEFRDILTIKNASYQDYKNETTVQLTAFNQETGQDCTILIIPCHPTRHEYEQVMIKNSSDKIHSLEKDHVFYTVVNT